MEYECLLNSYKFFNCRYIYTFAILKFNFLKITPIALQKIVDRISDGYVVLDEENTITDFNKTFLDMFNLKPENIRSKNFIRFLNNRKVITLNFPNI